MADRGRPSSYNPAFVRQAQQLCRLGATDQEIADFFEVHVSTIYRWKAEHSDFCEALKSGKESADDRVERSLFHKAVGYSFDAVKIMSYEGAVIEAPYREHVPPDTTAAIFWLKNRRPEAWRDRKEHDVNIRRDPNTLTDADLAAIAAGSGGGAAEEAGDQGQPGDVVH